MEKFKELIEELRNLNLPKNEFAIFGSGLMIIRGLREGHDLDVIVKKDLWNKLKKKYPIDNQKYSSPFIGVGEIEFWNDWKPWFENSDELIDSADIIDGLRFVKLDKVLVWKREFGREKDLKDVEIIEDYLKKKE